MKTRKARAGDLRRRRLSDKPAARAGSKTRTKTGFEGLVGLMAYMRGPCGCPWDRAQRMEDFRVHLKNESEEVLAAIRSNDYENLREELGDLLWNILFVSQIASEEKKFGIYDVMAQLREKIIRRHPHVFGKVKAKTPKAVVYHYRRIKEMEKSGTLPHG